MRSRSCRYVTMLDEMSDGASYVLSPYLQTLAAPEPGDPGMRRLREQLARDAPPADIVIIGADPHPG